MEDLISMIKINTLLSKNIKIYIALSINSQEECDKGKRVEYLNGSNTGTLNLRALVLLS